MKIAKLEVKNPDAFKLTYRWVFTVYHEDFGTVVCGDRMKFSEEQDTFIQDEDCEGTMVHPEEAIVLMRKMQSHPSPDGTCWLFSIAGESILATKGRYDHEAGTLEPSYQDPLHQEAVEEFLWARVEEGRGGIGDQNGCYRY